MSPSLSRSLRPLRTVALLGSWALLVAPSACSTAEASAPPPPAEPKVRVTTAPATTRAVPRHLTLTGTLLANRHSELAADGAGKVLATFVERGEFVRAGAPIARLDARAAQLSRAEALAQAKGAEVQAMNARLECERAENLFAQQAISRAEYDRIKTGCSAASYTTDAAEARQGLASKAVSDALVRAPFAGMVAERFIELGEYVVPGKVVATIVELNPLRLELTVPEASVSAIQPDHPVEFTVASHPGERFVGKLRYVAPVVRRKSRDLVVEAIVDNPDSRLRPGMFATCRLPIGETRLPVVPAAAVAGTPSSPRVFVVQDRRIEERVVQLGERMGDGVAVRQGLRDGEQVVVEPSAAVKDGAAVQ